MTRLGGTTHLGLNPKKRTQTFSGIFGIFKYFELSKERMNLDLPKLL